ncbi:MAG TPA: glycosyltransferase family 4 protein [Gallicola sp.]|nr:glycosyltransferase family 4 protein [Gallicola sp.]
MKIVYIHRASFEKRPPVISTVINLLKLRHKVILITTNITPDLKFYIENLGGVVEIAPYTIKHNKFKVLITLFDYRKKVANILKKYDPKNHVLWIEGNYTILALQGMIDRYKYIFQIQELHKNKLQFYSIKRYISKALLVFMPEYNRAYFYKILFKLKSLPIVLPNKPYFVPSTNELNKLRLKYSNYISLFEDKKIILYQGLISEERDLSPFMKAFNKLDSSYSVVLLGKDYGVLEQYKKLCPRLIHIPYINAPDYLLFTSMAYIGIVTYVGDTLNNAYCAPNKIFEYSAFSVPMIGNSIPGLKYAFLEYDLGEIVIENNENSILEAINKISFRYSDYSKNANRLYNEVDNKETVKVELNKIKTHIHENTTNNQ